jgi:class 3 adenylate cyclase/putative methionine-R-sulfoxide reductase with GAF domain
MTDTRLGQSSPSSVLEGLGDVFRSLTRPGFELGQVLQIVIERSVELVGATTGNIAIRQGEVFRIAAAVALGEEYDRIVRDREYRPERDTVIGRALLEGGVVQIEDVLADPEYTLRDAQRAGRYRTVLALPMIQEGSAIGVIALGRSTVAPFDDEEVALISLFADQAAVAIRIATLLTETREALDRETAVSDVLQRISGSAFDLDQVLQTVIERAVILSHAEFGNILRLDESTGIHRQVASYGDVPPAYWEVIKNKPFRPERGTVVGRALIERRPVHIDDVLADPDYTFVEAQRAGGFRTTLGVPMLRDGLPIGVIVLNRRQVKPFTEREISLLTTFADQAVLAIENVRLFQTVERQRTELARFAPQVASLLSSEQGVQLLAGHRREVTALFADLRGFTAFAESAEPEEVLGVLREYHALAGGLVVGNGGTVEHFAGDGLMAFFNDPAPVPDHQRVAVRTAVELRDGFAALAAQWRKRGYELGLGIGVSVGYATLGRIGFEGRYDYGAVGNVVIVASRLSDAAAAAEVLISQRLHAAVEEGFETEPVPDLDLKGFSRPVPAFRVVWASGDRRTGTPR